MDLILLDVDLPNIRGTEGIELLRSAFNSIPIIMLSAMTDSTSLAEARNRGASGFLHKSAEADDIVKAIRKVLSGGTCFDKNTAEPPAKTDSLFGVKKRIATLTVRQIDVLKILCEGISNKLIARRLCVSENNVRVHISAIFSALGASNRSEAILIAKHEGIHDYK